MAVVVSSPLASSSTSAAAGCDSIPARVRELLNDVERQIQVYISDQRARGPLWLADEDDGVARAQQQLNRSTPAYHPGPYRYPHLQRARSLSLRKSWRCSSTTQDLLLQAIFKTPECRIQKSWSCELRRRDATFHRVEQAVVEATERRVRQWTQDAVDPMRGDPREIPAVHWEHADGCWLVSHSPSEPPRIEEVDDSTTPPTSAAVTPRPVTRYMLSDGDRQALCFFQEQGGWWGHDRSCSLSSTLTLSSRRQSLCVIALSENVGAGDDALLHYSSDSAVSAPSPPSLTADDGRADNTTAPTPWTSSERCCQPSSNPSQVSEAFSTATNLPSGSQAEAAQTDLSTQTRSSANQVKNWKWLRHRKMTSVRRVKSVSRRAKRQAKRKNQLATAKAKVVGESVVDLISGLAFHRVEAQEMIDTSQIRAEQRGLTSRWSSSTIEDFKDRRAASRERRRSEQLHRYRGGSSNEARPLPEGYDHSLATSSQGMPQHGRSWSVDRLPAIPEVSPILGKDAEALFTTPSTAMVISPITPDSAGHYQDTAPESPPLGRPLGARSISPVSPEPFPRPDTVQSSETTRRIASSDELDWTAFQMAISGPTGDYLMEGDACSEPSGSDDIVEWFLTYGFESEGLLVQSENTMEEDEEDELMEPPEEPLPTTFAAGADTELRVTEMHLTEPWQKEPTMSDGWQMSCNLTDLGDYLNFEIHHIGAFGGDLSPEWN